MATALKDGDLVDAKYRIVRHLGRGAWASVYEGVNARIGRRVAIKVLGHETLERAGVVERFEREAQAATRIDSEHVVHVFDLGTLEDGRPYIVMELLEGEDLAHVLLKKGPLGEERAVRYVVQALRGLADAHAEGIVHRDIKPDNIFLAQNKHGDEIVKIVDFGISSSIRARSRRASRRPTAVLGARVHVARAVPRRAADGSSLRSLFDRRGAVRSGHRSPPASRGDVQRADVQDRAGGRAEPHRLPADLDRSRAVLEKALGREVSQRYQTAHEFEVALAWAEGRGYSPDAWFHRPRRVPPAPGSDSSAPALASSGAIRVSNPDDPRGVMAGSDRASAPSGPVLVGAAPARTMEALAPLLPPQEASSEPLPARWRMGMLFAAVLVAAAVTSVLVLTMLAKSAPEETAPVATASAPGSTALPAESAPAVTTAPLATQDTPPVPEGEDGAKVPSVVAPTANPSTHRKPIAPKPSASAAPVASASAAPSSSAPQPAPSAKSVVDGRTIRVNF